MTNQELAARTDQLSIKIDKYIDEINALSVTIAGMSSVCRFHEDRQSALLVRVNGFERRLWGLVGLIIVGTCVKYFFT